MSKGNKVLIKKIDRKQSSREKKNKKQKNKKHNILAISSGAIIVEYEG